MLINNETPTPPRGSTYRVNDRRETPTPSKTSDYPRDVKLPREDEIPRLPRTYAFTPIDTARIGKPTNAAEYSMHGSIPPIRRAPRRDERMDTAARYMHAARRKVENDYTFDRSDPPKTRRGGNFHPGSRAARRKATNGRNSARQKMGRAQRPRSKVYANRLEEDRGTIRATKRRATNR